MPTASTLLVSSATAFSAVKDAGSALHIVVLGGLLALIGVCL